MEPAGVTYEPAVVGHDWLFLFGVQRAEEVIGLRQCKLCMAESGHGRERGSFFRRERTDGFVAIEKRFEMVEMNGHIIGVLSSATNRLDLAVRGTNNGVYHIVWTSGSWGTWEALPGATNNKPALTVYDGTLYLAVTGTSTGIYYNTLALSSGSWTGWTNIPGATPSYPALAASNTYAYCNIVAQGTDNGIYWASVQ